MENGLDMNKYIASINKSMINVKPIQIRTSSTLPASQTKIGSIKSQNPYNRQPSTTCMIEIKSTVSELKSASRPKIDTLRLTNLYSSGSPSQKDNRSSRQKNERACKDHPLNTDDSKKENLTIAAEKFIKKIAFLQAKIKELSKERIQTANQLNNKIESLEKENTRLAILVKSAYKETTPDRFCKSSTFDLQEMLQNQISINLQLREELQRINGEMKAITSKCIELESLAKQSNIQKKQRSKIEQLESELNIITIKSKRLQQENQRKNKEIQSLQQQSDKTNQQIYQFKCQNESLHLKIAKLEKPQCKKCKDLLHTVFRLNSQLNKK